jgi:hypothetical protein
MKKDGHAVVAKIKKNKKKFVFNKKTKETIFLPFFSSFWWPPLKFEWLWRIYNHVACVQGIQQAVKQ